MYLLIYLQTDLKQCVLFSLFQFTNTSQHTHNKRMWQFCAEDIKNNDNKLWLWNISKALMNIDFQSSN